jgi:hypothetical protein
MSVETICPPLRPALETVKTICPAREPASRPDLWPWAWNKNGNLTRTFRDAVLTVFRAKDGTGWRWSIRRGVEVYFGGRTLDLIEARRDCWMHALCIDD